MNAYNHYIKTMIGKNVVLLIIIINMYMLGKEPFWTHKLQTLHPKGFI